MIENPPAPPMSIGACATLACVWEATAPKPGNVYRGADFGDLSYVDLIAAAAISGPIMEHAGRAGVGATVLAAVRATRAIVAGNPNLGMLLLLAPLAAVGRDQDLRSVAPQIVDRLTVSDAQQTYRAIQLAQPGGLGRVAEADVHSGQPPEVTLKAAMQLAADRDLIARQYVSGFADVFRASDRIVALLAQRSSLSAAIVRAFLELLAARPDTLIARKCGRAAAEQASARAAAVIAKGEPGAAAYESAVADLDFYLRADGNRRNPGASADVIAAALFVMLCEGRVDFPVKFYS